jgi:hypothetical protein
VRVVFACGAETVNRFKILGSTVRSSGSLSFVVFSNGDKARKSLVLIAGSFDNHVNLSEHLQNLGGEMVSEQHWFWPSSEEVNDFPDPVGFDAEWSSWPGDLSNGPSSYAEIFSREYIQNSWDSIQAARTENGKKRTTDGINFRFHELTGIALANFLSATGINEFGKRFTSFSEKQVKDSRLQQSDLVKSSKPKSLRILVCSEVGGDGMYGHWKTGGSAEISGSRLRYALIQTASEKASSGSGGSWGHGKKAIAIASKCRSVLVYTCSREHELNEDRAGVTRRFLGVTYWRRHTSGKSEHVGLGVLGEFADPKKRDWTSFEPLVNEEADSLVSALGLDSSPIRNPELLGDRGTTYIIIEPSFEPEDLLEAIERNWWPILDSQKLSISISGYDGVDLLIDPSSKKELVPFLKAFHVANGLETSFDRQSVKIGDVSVGNLAVVVDVSENGWSYKSDVPDNTSIVALVRNDMVIAYQSSPAKRVGKPPFARGVLNVDREINADASELLKLAEPHLHNTWRTAANDMSTPVDSAELASKTLVKIHDEVLRVRKQFMKPEQQSDLHFDVFADVFSGSQIVVSPQKKKKKPVAPREFQIHGVSRALLDANIVDPTQIRIRAKAEISLSDAVPRKVESLLTKVSLQWRVMEEGSSGGVVDDDLADHFSVTWPAGFKEITPGVAIGELGRVPLFFEWDSDFFPDDWQVSPLPIVDRELQ